MVGLCWGLEEAWNDNDTHVEEGRFEAGMVRNKQASVAIHQLLNLVECHPREMGWLATVGAGRGMFRT